MITSLEQLCHLSTSILHSSTFYYASLSLSQSCQQNKTYLTEVLVQPINKQVFFKTCHLLVTSILSWYLLFNPLPNPSLLFLICYPPLNNMYADDFKIISKFETYIKGPSDTSLFFTILAFYYNYVLLFDCYFSTVVSDSTELVLFFHICWSVTSWLM